MMRSFMLVTAGVGTVIGWFLMMTIQIVVDPVIAHVLGTATACLFVGTVSDVLLQQ